MQAAGPAKPIFSLARALRYLNGSRLSEFPMRLWIALSVLAVLALVGPATYFVFFDRGETAQRLSGDPHPEFYPEGHPQPKAVVLEEMTHDFGFLQIGGVGKTKFTLRNEGESDLKLSKGHVSCKCTLAELPRLTLAPGEEMVISIEWSAEEPNPRFQEMVSILTNDREQPSLDFIISGQITKVLQTEPDSLIVQSIPSGQNETASFVLYSSAFDHFKVLGHEWSDPETADSFAAEFTPAAQEDLQRVGGRSGYRVNVHVKPGLPLGRFSQRLIMETDIEEQPPLEFPVKGTVIGEISVIGGSGEWDPAKGLLKLGQIRSRKGTERKLRLIVRGVDQPIEVKDVRVTPPEALAAHLGETETVGENFAIPLRIEVPPGSPATNCLGTGKDKFGEIFIETDHPRDPKVRILVQFAVVKD